MKYMGGILRRRLVLGNAVGQAYTWPTALCYFSPKLIHTQSTGTTDTGCFIKLLIQFKVSLEWRCHSPFKSQAMYSQSTLDFSGPDQ